MYQISIVYKNDVQILSISEIIVIIIMFLGFSPVPHKAIQTPDFELTVPSQ